MAATERLGRLVDWEKMDRGVPGATTMRVDVAPVRDLLARVGNPQTQFRAVHVAGTKGKGSVAALVAAGLERAEAQGAALRVGLYTSPHVVRINERVRIAGVEITDAEFGRVLCDTLDARDATVEANSPGAESSWFDVLTAAAFLAFARAEVDWAVVECGLGGRLDSTNVLDAPVTCITNIELEHTEVLGTTRTAIAREKAGIIAAGTTVVTGLGDPARTQDEAGAVLAEVAVERGADVRWLALEGIQTLAGRNAVLAGAVLEALAERGVGAGAGLLDDGALAAGRLPARLEHFELGGVAVVLDGAHTPGSITLALQDLATDPGLEAPPVLILGLGRDKDRDGVLKRLRGRVDRVVCTSGGTGPMWDPEDLVHGCLAIGIPAETAPDPWTALQSVLKGLPEGRWVLVTGSLRLAGSLRGHLIRP